MGSIISRQNSSDDEVDVGPNHVYKYPPKSGSYFGGHFIMGGEKFDATQPEAYLFGENTDLNFLGSRPSPFPYPAPQPNEPTKTLQSLINIRKESLKFVKSRDCVLPNSVSLQYYSIEFTFDSDVRCSITIHYFCSEEVTPTGVVYTPKDASLSSETFHYKAGANQQFCQTTHTFCPNFHRGDELCFLSDCELLPVVIHCVAEEGEEPKQSHVTTAIIETISEESHVIKALKQKQFVDGLCYLLQEIYGIENKSVEYSKGAGDDDVEDNGSECVICMSDIRNTLILPCRHLCLCNGCADSLRYQANNCPICRSPFRALLQIQALRKIPNNSLLANACRQLNNSSESQDSNVPQGYESLSLLEALNGMSQVLNGAIPIAASNSEASRDSPRLPKRHVLSRMLSGSNASLQGRRKNLQCKASAVSLSEPNVTSVGKDKISVVPIDYEDAPKIKKDKLSLSRTSVKSATFPRPSDVVRMVNETSPIDDKNDKAETISMKSLTKTDERNESATAAGIEEDSDYYTPEDPSPADDDGDRSQDSIILSETKVDVVIDGESKGSSTDSFSSTSSSSKLLLTTDPPQGDESIDEV